MKAFDHSELEAYKAEAKEKWGQTAAYKEYEAKTQGDPRHGRDDSAGGMDRILADFAQCKAQGETPDSARAQSLAADLQTHITEHYYRCTKQILAGLGQMYVADVRFQRNIDKHGDGTAAFIRDAILIYCER